VLDKLRGRIQDSLLSLGRAAARIMPSPTGWTVVGALISILAAVAFATGGYRGELSGGLLVLVSGLFDVFDGSVARATNRISKRGAFLDSTLDRVGESSIYLGVLIGGYMPSWVVFLALACSLLVSYSRAKADSLSVNLAGVGVGERSERLLVLVIASVLGLVEYGVAVVAILAGFTFITRVAKVTSALRDTPAVPASG
jgi:archaetidylinositol phosphate synthase